MNLTEKQKRKAKYRLEKYSIPEPNTGCIIWVGSVVGSMGYGTLRITENNKHKIYRAHRLSYYLNFGFFDKSLLVCHKCDNPKCINPKHLFLGTAKDNVIDCINKGRRKFGKANCGHKNINAKLSEGDVVFARKMKASGVSTKKLAFMYGISQRNMSNICFGKSYKNIPISKEELDLIKIDKRDRKKAPVIPLKIDNKLKLVR